MFQANRGGANEGPSQYGMAYHIEKAPHLPHPGLLGTPPRAPLGPFEPSGGPLESALGLFESALEPFEYALAPSECACLPACLPEPARDLVHNS